MEAKAATRAAYEILAKAAPEFAPRVRLWDGDELGPLDAVGTIVLRHPGALRAALLPATDLTAGEAYIHDDVDFEGNLLSILEFGFQLQQLARQPVRALRLFRLLRALPAESRRAEHPRPEYGGRKHSKRRDAEAVRSHYDTGNSFYGYFLDEEMVYSCGYFLDPSEDLATAQRRKLDIICRKLGLRPGQRFLDVGCGWGALALHAAKHYGAEVTGITLSPEQAAYARQRVSHEGLDASVRILELDYRDVDGDYDAIASVGMFEHVGAKQMATYFEKLRSVLAPRGALLNHAIGTRDRSKGKVTPTFVNTYVFPDGELLAVDTVLGVAESAGFEVRDLESMRMAYGRTLRHWVTNLEGNREKAVADVGETIYRIWRLYMAGSVLAFERGAISVYQMLCVDPERWWTYGRKQLLAADDV